MAKETVRLTEDEVHKRVSTYQEPEVTSALYDFGKILIAANRERMKTLESKAVGITGYSLAVLAFLVSREPAQSVVAGVWPPKLIVAAGLFAAGALATTAAALLVRNHRWLSDDQWFQNADDMLQHPDMLKRCHVLALHAANCALTKSNDWKASGIYGDRLR